MPGLDDDPPAQQHSDTSLSSARSLSRRRVLSQERWVYETLRHCSSNGLADWQLWDTVQAQGEHLLFDQLSSLRRARIGLYWRSGVKLKTVWHPIEDSGRRVIDPESNKRTVVWRIKGTYYAMPYSEWAEAFRTLARGKQSSELFD